MASPEQHPHFTFALGPDERIEHVVPVSAGHLALTDRRLILMDDERRILDVPMTGIRLIEFMSERGRPATLTVVPEHPGNAPQILGVEPAHIPAALRAVELVSQRLTPAS